METTVKRTLETPLDATVRGNIVAARKNQETGTEFYNLSAYYKELLGFPYAFSTPSPQHVVIDENHYRTTTLSPLDSATVEHLTLTASEKTPVIIEGVAITGQYVAGSTGAVHSLVDLGSVDENYLIGTGRSIFYAPVKTKVFYLVGNLAANYSHLGGVAMINTLVTMYRDSHPGYKNAIEKGELEDFIKFAEAQPKGARALALNAPKSDEPPADFTLVPSLDGAVVEKPAVVYSNELLCRSLYLSPERHRALGGTGKLPVFLAADVRPRVEALLKAAGRSLTYDFAWRKGVPTSPLYTAEQYTMIRSWIRAEGDRKKPSDEWVERAREVFPATKPTTMYALSRPLRTIAENQGEDIVVDAIKKHKAEMVKIVRFNTKRVEPIKLPSLLYTKETADALMKELTGEGV